MGGASSCACTEQLQIFGSPEELVTEPTVFIPLKSQFNGTDVSEPGGLLPVTSLVYIERGPPVGAHSSASTADGLSSRHSDVSMRTKTKTIQMTQTAGLGVVAVFSSKLEKTKLTAFMDRLHVAGIDTSKWGYGGSKSAEHLFWETFEQRGCIIIGGPSNLKRVTRLVKIKLMAEIFGVDHCLFSRMQFMHDGQTVERKQVPLRKLTWKEGCYMENLPAVTQTFSAEDCPFTENWKLGCHKTLEERLGLSQAWQEKHLVEDAEVYRYSVEDNVKSDGYPTLNTMYCIHEVRFRVRQPEHPGVACVGLPHGQEFATAEGDFNFHNQQHDNGLPIGTQLNIWTWIRSTVVVPSVKKEPSVVASAHKKDENKLIRRVPLPTTTAQLLTSMQHRLSQPLAKRPPSSVLWAAMENLQTDWKVAKQIARRITDPKYTLEDFNDDLSCFPELNLYLLDERASGGKDMPKSSLAANMSSGRTIGDEYQRTIGAFYAIYWLMRLEGDGKDGFSNGVDDDWQPIVLQDPDDMRVIAGDKRMAFKKNAMWPFFRKLLLNAGLLEEKTTKTMFKTTTKIQVNEQRLVSLLALTAFHDIMKMSMLLPVVLKEHEPFHGYKAGDTVGDHDHALGYVMEHYPTMLPSFRDLEAAEKKSVQFTQCNLCFNHGWFVQAEAPPGAIFTKFREALIRDHKSQMGQSDVALYFVHWITDLAGAEPSPLAGCEKFVTKFPLPVLNSFLRSFEFVEKIATQNETEVMQEYLKMRWEEQSPPVGPLPTGDSAIAKMRLLCMAQMNAPLVLSSFRDLVAEDADVLSLEMTRTGCVGQSFSAELVPKDAVSQLIGPAFLVYYGPAFLQTLGNDSAVRRLSILAEIYRCSREMWPASVAQVASNVTIRIDIIKALSFQAMQDAIHEGDVWMLVKHNETEAFVERSSKGKLNKMILTSAVFQVLDLGIAANYPDAK